MNKDNVTNESTICPECGGKKGKHKNGCSVPSWNKLKYATIDDKDYYDRINKVDE